MVEDGVAIGLPIFVALNPVAGNQLYVVAPVATKFALAPLQIVPPPVTLIVGKGVTVTVTIAVLEHPNEVPVTV